MASWRRRLTSCIRVHKCPFDVLNPGAISRGFFLSGHRARRMQLPRVQDLPGVIGTQRDGSSAELRDRPKT